MNFSDINKLFIGSNEVNKIYLGSELIYPKVLDTTPPIVTISYSTTEITNKNVTVTLSANEEVELINAGTWNKTGFSTEFKRVYTSNVNQEITVKDKAGNATVVNIEITNIDKTSPSISISSSVGSNGRYSSINLKLHDNKGIAKVTLNGKEYSRSGTWADLNFANMTNLIEGENTAVLYDLAGNTAEFKFIYDKTPPVIAIDKVVTIEVGDEFVEDIYDNISDNITPANELKVDIYPSANFDISKVGTYSINYMVKDEAKNYAVETRQVKVVDTTPPIINFENANKGSDYYYYNVNQGTIITYEDLMNYPTVTDNYDENPSVAVKGSINYYGKPNNIYNYDYSNGLDTTMGTGRYNITFEATDKAGNKSTSTLLIMIK